MGVLLDIIGGVIIGGTLLLMVMTFQLQLQENAMRLYYTSSMISHMDEVAETVNHVFSMVGIGFGLAQEEEKDTVCMVATENTIKFRTFWDYEKDDISDDPHTVEIVLRDAEDDWGRVMNIIQDGEIIFPMGHILFIEDMKLGYYDFDDKFITNPNTLTNRKDIMSAEVLLTFRRDSPWKPDQPLRSNLQLKCYFMNRYLQHGA